jgi:hypothetical protein
LADREFAPRQRALLIAIERHGSSEHGVIQGLSGEELAARAAHAHDIDLCSRDHARHLEALPAGIGLCDGARQGADLFRQCEIEPCRPAQAMPECVARGARLALGRLRTLAGAAIDPTGCAPRFADHPGSPPATGVRSVVHALF